MKAIMLLLIAAAMYGTPVLVYQTMVQPELDKIEQNYANADAIARRAAGLE